MSLALVNNNYVGELKADIATLFSIGATDLDLFHVMTTKGSKLRFPYLSVNTVVQEVDSLCDMVSSSGRSRELVDVELKTLGFEEVACNDEEFKTDYADAERGYFAQQPGPAQVAEWMMLHSDNFMIELQNLRWSGDTASATAALAYHDGIVKRIQAKAAYNATTNPEGYQKVTTTTVTASNAIQEILKVIHALPVAVKNDPMCKILISPTIQGLLSQQTTTVALSQGLASVPKLTYNPVTGQILDSTYFGAPVYIAYGLDATTANQNIIMAGLFGDSRKGVLKYGATDPMEGENIEVKLVADGDKTRMRAIHSQNVAVIPNLSQVAMNA